MNNNYIKVKIEGKNVNNYIKWLINEKINIIKLNILKHNELDIIIDYKDYHLLTKYSKTYKVSIIKKYGKLRLFEIIKNNIIILTCLILSIVFLYSLSNIIFSIDIIYNDKDIIEKVSKELEKYDIKKYKQKKENSCLEIIKSEILKRNKDILEWIEIEESGTKYIVKIVERQQEKIKEEYLYQSIVASKNSIIKSIKAYSGEKVKNINEYVNHEETIISGIIPKTDGTNVYTKATGFILGEVWYKIDIEFPLYYQEEKVTGKNKNIYVIKFLNKTIPLFPYKKYKQFKLETDTIIEKETLPLKIVKEKLYEANIIEEIYTEETAIEKATEIAKQKLLEGNKKIIEINNIEVLSKQTLNSKIKLNLYVSVTEDITKIIEIIPQNKEIQE